MIYVYPHLSKNDLGFVRIGGAGLGNLLYIFARAICFAEETGATVIWPTWPSIKVGPWIRHEKDKRFYADLFQPTEKYITGVKKAYLLATCKHVRINDYVKEIPCTNSDIIVIFDEQNCMQNFSGLGQHRQFIKQSLIDISREKNLRALLDDLSGYISLHIRLGDFSKNEDNFYRGENCTSAPLAWYLTIIKQIQAKCAHIKFIVFSDGTDYELSEILAIPNVERRTYGSSLGDIFALSHNKWIISSPKSTFSAWGIFLGDVNYITYKKNFYDIEKVSDESKVLYADKNGLASTDLDYLCNSLLE